jgi:hypothetical protein
MMPESDKIELISHTSEHSSKIYMLYGDNGKKNILEMDVKQEGSASTLYFLGTQIEAINGKIIRIRCNNEGPQCFNERVSMLPEELRNVILSDRIGGLAKSLLVEAIR